MQVYVDADGCPVARAAAALCARSGVPCTLVCDFAHEFADAFGARVVTVERGADSADYKIVNMVQKGDIVVTQDYGLAAMCLARGCICLNQNGMIYSAGNIDGLLFARHEARKARMAGGHLKGPKKRTAGQDAAFEKTFERLLAEHGQ